MRQGSQSPTSHIRDTVGFFFFRNFCHFLPQKFIARHLAVYQHNMHGWEHSNQLPLDYLLVHFPFFGQIGSGTEWDTVTLWEKTFRVLKTEGRWSIKQAVWARTAPSVCKSIKAVWSVAQNNVWVLIFATQNQKALMDLLFLGHVASFSITRWYQLQSILAKPSMMMMLPTSEN